MSKSSRRTVKGIAAGMIVGSMVSAVTIASMKPKPGKMIRKKAAKALDAMGNVMQNIAEYTK